MTVSTPSRRRVVLWGSLTALAPLSIDMYLPAFVQIGRDFAVSSGQMAYSLTAYFLGMCFGQLLHGPLSDRYGRVAMLRNGIALYLVASLVCALSPTFSLFLLARFLQAVGGCAALVIVRAMVRDQCDSSTSAKIFSRMVLVMGLAPMLAPSLGAMVAHALEWHSIFIVLALYAALMLWALQKQMVDDKPSTTQLSIVNALQQYQRLLRDRHFMRYLLCSAFSSAAMFAYIAGSPYVFIEYYGLNANQFAWVFGLNASAYVLSAQANVMLLKKIPAPRLLYLFQFLALLSVLFLLGVAWLEAPMMWYWLPITVFLGCLGITQPNAVALSLATQTDNIGSASALLGSVQFLLAMVASNSVGFFHHDNIQTLATVMAVCIVAGSATLMSKDNRSLSEK